MSRSSKRGMPWWLLILLGVIGVSGSASADDGGDEPGDDKPDEPGDGPGDEPGDEPSDPDAPPPRACRPDQTRDDEGRCVDLEQDCPDGQRWAPDSGECVDIPPRATPKGPNPGLDDPKIFNDYPTPATFYQVVSGDYELGVAKKYVQSCLFLAARDEGGLDDAEANAWATARNTAQMRYTGVEFFTCCPDNDMRLGTYRFKPCTGQHSGGCTHPGNTGRGIRFLKTGGDTESRARAGEPWRRGPTLGSPGQSPSAATAIPAGQRAFPLIYLPEPDYAALWNSGGTDWRPSPATWGNGESKYFMPPAFRELGFEGVPDGVQWGCSWPL